MADIDIAKLRVLAEAATQREYDAAFTTAANPAIILALLDRIEELEEQANAAARVVASDYAELKRLRALLAAVMKARDEACDIAAEGLLVFSPSHLNPDAVRTRLASLRKVGKEES